MFLIIFFCLGIDTKTYKLIKVSVPLVPKEYRKKKLAKIKLSKAIYQIIVIYNSGMNNFIFH